MEASANKYEIKHGFFLLIDCVTCPTQRFYTSDTKDDIMRQIKNDKWKLYPTRYVDNTLTGNFANVCEFYYRDAVMYRYNRIKYRNNKYTVS